MTDTTACWLALAAVGLWLAWRWLRRGRKR